ncbi:aminomethyl transferase family protein [Acetobacterium carbinolicum]|uniref:aminomethyl transferase family protein n=1 Tax=Acetobacterium carbinolicum TaxID=52690 RepID=UPI0039BF74BD
MSKAVKADFSVSGLGGDSVLGGAGTMSNPANEGATLFFQMAPGMNIPYEYGGVKQEIQGYRDSAWIGTTLMISPIYDVVGKDAVKFLNAICINDFTKLGLNGLRHAVICNDKGQIMTDGVVIRIAEDRYRTYWLNPPIDYLLKKSGLDVSGEDKTGTEYFIQIAGEKSLEILEDAFEADLHDIKFARHRKAEMDGKTVEVIRLGMSGNLAYEIHGPMSDFDAVYRKVWASGEKFGATKLGMHAYNLFNHTEAGFPNIHLHYPFPWFESDQGLSDYLAQNPALGGMNSNRKLAGSVGDDLQSRFVTPYDVGWDFLVNFNHEFTGKPALEQIAKNPGRRVTTLEWNADDVAAVFATMLRPGQTPCDDITKQSDLSLGENSFNGYTEYRADKVLVNGRQIGISSGRIISYPYNSMISLAFIAPEYAAPGTEVTVLWGTPGTPQKEIRAIVAKYPYNQELIRNEDRDVAEIPGYRK